MNIFLHELRAYKKSTVIWTCSLVALIVLFLSLFPAFSKDAADVQKLLEGYPQDVLKALGISQTSFLSILGFYSYLFTYVVLCGAIQAMSFGTSIVSKETNEKTADFLLTKPVSRKKVLTTKLLAVLTLLLSTDIVYLICAAAMALAVRTEDFSMKIFLMISITLFFIQVIFMALGVAAAVIVSKVKSVSSVSLGVVFGFFIISMFSSVIDDNSMRYITPFKYFDASYIIKNASYELSFVITGIIFTIAAIAVSYIIYSKKDIHTV